MNPVSYTHLDVYKRQEAAKLYGATHVINYKIAPVDEQVLEITNGAGVDVAIIAGGNPDTLATAVKITKPGGNISNVNYFGEGDILPIPRLEWGCGKMCIRDSAKTHHTA